jgi:hypothetical protein
VCGAGRAFLIERFAGQSNSRTNWNAHAVLAHSHVFSGMVSIRDVAFCTGISLFHALEWYGLWQHWWTNVGPTAAQAVSPSVVLTGCCLWDVVHAAAACCGSSTSFQA